MSGGAAHLAGETETDSRSISEGETLGEREPQEGRAGCQRPRGEPSAEEVSGAGVGEARADGEAAGGT